MVMVMREPLPALTRLDIESWDRAALVFPAGFLGGSTPCLQEVILSGIPYPALPALLLSASDLVTLNLHRIPPASYFSPEALGVSLAALPSLKSLAIEFRSPTPRPDRLRAPPVTHTVLPFLTSFRFHGAYEYLEALVAQIDSPQMNQMFIAYLNEPVDLQAAQLSKYIHRSLVPEQHLFRRANVYFHGIALTFTLYRQANYPDWDRHPVETIIGCKAFRWQFSHLVQMLNRFSATLYIGTIIHLELHVQLEEDRQMWGAGDVEWLNFLHQFPAMRVLHVPRELAEHIALALENITVEMVAKVLPFLELVCLVGQPPSSVAKFVTARRSTNRPITIVDTIEELNERVESYVRK
jgi:hypothetical protein